MKLLYITVRSDFGGGPRHVAQLITELENKYEIFLAVPYGEPYGKEWRKDRKIKKILTIPYRKFSIMTLFTMKSFIKENNITIVHSHGNGAGIYSRILKILCPNIKVVHTFHGITDNYTSKIKKILNLIIGRSLKIFTDAFILVSNGEKLIGEKLGFIENEKSYVIYNGVEDCGIKIKRNDKDINIITLSRFDYQKNMDMAFEIAKGFKDDNKVRFTWVGDGNDFLHLKEREKKESLNITFIGFSTTPMDYLKKADIYLSTSRFEGLPYALIEASSVGLPIVATDVEGNNECVKNNENGYLFRTVEEGTLCIKSLLYKNIRLRMGENSRKYFLEKFTIRTMITKLIKIYEDLANL